jgi:hypothetical protein
MANLGDADIDEGEVKDKILAFEHKVKNDDKLDESA